MGCLVLQAIITLSPQSLSFAVLNVDVNHYFILQQWALCYQAIMEGIIGTGEFHESGQLWVRMTEIDDEEKVARPADGWPDVRLPFNAGLHHL